jgi:hypothetical protein
MMSASFINMAPWRHRSIMEKKRMTAELDPRPKRTEPAYSEIELGQSTDISDFDWSTLGVLAGIVAFTLLMLSVLLVAF